MLECDFSSNAAENDNRNKDREREKERETVSCK